MLIMKLQTRFSPIIVAREDIKMMPSMSRSEVCSEKLSKL
jgi:hypothetical protein